MRDFDGRLVFVPGGSAGIGLAAARKLAQRGAHVCLFARREDVLQRAVVDVEAQRRSPAQRVGARVLDVADAAQVAQVLSAAIAELGVPDVLLNCAGQARPDYFERISPERLQQTLALNLGGCWNTAQAIAPAMKQRRSGYIVNTSSLAGLIGVFGYTDYCAAKFGLIGFSEGLRAELAPHGVEVSVLCPPDTDTPGFAEENRFKPKETIAASAGGGLLKADDVAEELFRGMARRRFLILPGREAKLAWWAKRLAPWLVERVMRQKVTRAG